MALVGAALLSVLSPMVAGAISAATPTWDNLPESLNLLFGGLSIAALLLVVSFGAGLRVWREHKVVLLWVVPIGAALTIGAGLAIAALVAPYWSAGWL